MKLIVCLVICHELPLLLGIIWILSHGSIVTLMIEYWLLNFTLDMFNLMAMLMNYINFANSVVDRKSYTKINSDLSIHGTVDWLGIFTELRSCFTWWLYPITCSYGCLDLVTFAGNLIISLLQNCYILWFIIWAYLYMWYTYKAFGQGIYVV